MRSIYFNSDQDHLNEIEYFVDSICEELNLSNSLYGNLLISITETIDVLKKYASSGRISLEGDHREIKVSFDRLVKLDGVDSFFNNAMNKPDLYNSDDSGIFMINALSDDIVFDYGREMFSCVFRNKQYDQELSSHRKNFLKKYLHQEVSTKV